MTATDFAAQLAAVRGDLEVHINSPGGDVVGRHGDLQRDREHPGNTRTVVDGLAASAASFIAQAGNTRLAAPGSMR